MATHLGNKRKIVGIIVARQGSSRLPGKALVEVEGKPMIGHLIDRLKACEEINEIVVATSTNTEDEAIVRYAKSQGVGVYAGDPEDVLDRMYRAAKSVDADVVVEVGGDCPFVGPALIREGIAVFKKTGVDFVSNAFTPPMTYPVGYDFICATMSALERAHGEATLTPDRRQPFHYIETHPKEFSHESFSLKENRNAWRWTLDYPEDLAFVRAVYAKLYSKNPLFEFEEIKELLEHEPEITKLNAMHNDPVTSGKAAWHTGSYEKEMQADIARFLAEAYEASVKKDFSRAEERYTKARALIEDLEARAKFLRDQK